MIVARRQPGPYRGVDLISMIGDAIGTNSPSAPAAAPQGLSTTTLLLIVGGVGLAAIVAGVLKVALK